MLKVAALSERAPYDMPAHACVICSPNTACYAANMIFLAPAFVLCQQPRDRCGPWLQCFEGAMPGHLSGIHTYPHSDVFLGGAQATFATTALGTLPGTEQGDLPDHSTGANLQPGSGFKASKMPSPCVLEDSGAGVANALGAPDGMHHVQQPFQRPQTPTNNAASTQRSPRG